MNQQAGWTGLRRRAIVDQQLWYLGRDIAGPFGNALLQYGFERRRSPSGSGSTAYLLPLKRAPGDAALAEGATLVCWGFGMYAGVVLAPDVAETPWSAGTLATLTLPFASPWAGATIERFRDTPGLVRTPLSPFLHQVAELPRTTAPRTDVDRAFAAGTMRAIALTLADYERWAVTSLGVSHRNAALRDAPRHKRHRFSHVPELSALWEDVASEQGVSVPFNSAYLHETTGVTTAA